MKHISLFVVFALVQLSDAMRVKQRVRKQYQAAKSTIGKSSVVKNESDVALFKDCESASTDAVAGPIYTAYQGREIKVKGVEVTGLTCLGAGGFGLVFAGVTTDGGHDVIVKLFFEKRVDTRAFKWAEFIQAQVEKNPRATGASYFMTAVTDAQVTEDLYAQVWLRAPGYNLAQIEGPLHMTTDGDLIGDGHDSKKYGFDKFFKPGVFTKKADNERKLFYNREAFLTCLQKTMEGLLFLWGIGLEHRDVQGSNIMWDSEKLTFIDYDMIRLVKEGEKNGDVADAVRISQNWRAPKGQKAKNMEDFFVANAGRIGKSFDDFKAFVEQFTARKVVLAAKPTQEEFEALARKLAE